MSSFKTVYITTPIYYPSGQPHIGHAYTTYYANALRDFYAMCGYQTYFLTGTDEHGQKIEIAAKQANMEPIKFINKFVDKFKELWTLMKINYDQFIRTTNYQHIQTIQKIFAKYQSKNLIYLGTWQGLYCTSCEENYTLTQAVIRDNKTYCITNHLLTTRNEPSYFFKMSLFSDYIRDLLINHNFLLPMSRNKELLNNFLSEQLPDLSVSRTTFTWGVHVLADPKHVVYVWIDALFNYLSALGYLSVNDSLYERFWNQSNAKIIHITAKEISRFHAIYWPILLKALDLKLFSTLISHGWILANDHKMSKSLKNFVDPFFILKHFPHDGFRYFLLTLPLDKDHNFSYQELVNVYNNVLVNQYGNLIARLGGMVKKYSANQVPAFDQCFFDPLVTAANEQLLQLVNQFQNLIENNELNLLLDQAHKLLNSTGKLIENLKPWELAKTNQKQKLNGLLFFLHRTATLITYIYQPICKSTTSLASKILGIDCSQLNIEWFLNVTNCSNACMITDKPILYERLSIDHFDQLNNNE